MKCIIYTADNEISKIIKETILEILPDAKVDISENPKDCFTRGGSYGYAFIGDSDEGMPWTDLVSHLANQGVRVYFVTDIINKSVLKHLTDANGLSAINSSDVEQEIKSMFIGFTEEKTNEDSDEDEDDSFFDSTPAAMDIQEYLQLKAKKYPALIVSFHGAKGGVGKTCIAVNTAVQIAKMGLKTVVIDFDIENGNLAATLHLTVDRDLKDIIKGNFNYTDESSFTRHSCGLYVLPGLKIPAESELITSEICERILGRLARIFDVIIVDTGSLEIDPMLVALQVSSKTYFVINCDMTAIAKTYDLIEDAKMLGVDTTKAKLVINRTVKGVPLDKGFVSECVSIPILTEVPETKEVLKAINNGMVPLELPECKSFREKISIIAKDIIKDTELAEKLSTIKQETSQKKGLFTRWFQRG